MSFADFLNTHALDYLCMIGVIVLIAIIQWKDKKRIKELETEIETLKKQQHLQNVEDYPNFADEK